LRLLASLAGLPVHGVEHALGHLEGKGIVRSIRRQNRRFVSLRPGEEWNGLLRLIFREVERFELSQRSRTYSATANRILEFCDSAAELFRELGRHG